MTHTNHVALIPNAGWDRRIHVFRNGSLVDTFLVVTDRFVVMIDTMINPATAEQILAHATASLTDGRQLLVVNTHADYDHCWGNQVFAGPHARHPAPILGSDRSPAIFHEPESLAFLRQLQAREPDVFGAVEPTPPNVLVAGRVEIDGGDLSLRLLPTPGHTVDHLSVYLPEIRTLLAGDAAELPFPAARTVAGLPEMRRSLRSLADLRAEVVLYCHAPETSGPALLDANLAYFDCLESACRAAIERGVGPGPPDGADLSALTGLPYEAATPAGEPWCAVHDHYKGQAHADQIRMMFDWLGSAE